MKSPILIITFLLFVKLAVAQVAQLSMKDGSVKTVTIQAISDKQLFCREGNQYLDQISIITFGKDQVAQSTVQRLIDSGIKVNTDDQLRQPTKSPVMVVAKETNQDGLMDNLEGLYKFREQRNAGKALQLLGVVGSCVALGMALDGKEVKPAVLYAAGGVSGIGFIIDMDASRHLRLKQ